MNERLRELRIAFNMNQEEFGKLLGITKSGVSDIESGRRKVTEQHIIMLKSQKPQINEAWLRNGNGEMFIPKSRNQQLSDFMDTLIHENDSFKKRLITALCNLKESDWAYLENLLVDLVGKDILSAEPTTIPSTPEEQEAQYPPVDTQKKTG